MPVGVVTGQKCRLCEILTGQKCRYGMRQDMHAGGGL